MHSRGIQHQDLKPPNILLRPGEILLTDFGMARDWARVEKSATDYYAGHSWGYAAPEVVDMDWVNVQEADIYSLGCVLLYLVTIIYAQDLQIKRPQADEYPHGAIITVSSNSKYSYPSRVSLQRILTFPATSSCSWPVCFYSIARSVQQFKKSTANFSRYRTMIAPITHHVV